jgi:hypothetical protein
MRLKRILSTLAAMCILCAVASPSQTSLHGYSKNGISRMLLDAHAPDQPPKYSRSEIKKMIRDARTAEDFERLGNHFDYQSLLFEQKADEQLNELGRLLALRYHAKSYPSQVDYTRELLKEYRTKADECSARASAYRAHAAITGQTQ